MIFLLFPFVALVAMVTVGAIMFVLKYGPKYLNLRNYTFNRDNADEKAWSGKAYSQPVSNA